MTVPEVLQKANRIAEKELEIFHRAIGDLQKEKKTMIKQTIEERLIRLEGALVEYTNYIPPPQTEELHCGLTEPKWQRVIDEGFRVEVGDCQEVDWIGKSTTVLRHLTNVVPDDCYPYKTRLEQWTRARIPKEVGIRKPHFGGKCPCDPEQQVTVKFEQSFAWVTPQPAKVFHWEHTVGEFRIIEYIELP